MDIKLDFSDLTEIEIPFKIKDKEYVLKEANGEAAAKYRNAAVSSAIVTEDKDGGRTLRTTTIGDIQPMLVSLCLFSKNPNGTLSKVSIDTIKQWPDRVVTKLFDTIKEISRLDEAPESVEELVEQRNKLDERIKELQETEAKKSPTTGVDG